VTIRYRFVDPATTLQGGGGGESWALDTNLPSGLTLRLYTEHNVEGSYTNVTPGSWDGMDYAERATGNIVTLITDATAPSPITLTGQSDDTNTGASVINQNWAGIADGESPDFLYFTPSAGSRSHIFVSTVTYISDEMIQNPPMRNEVKFLEWLMTASSAWLGLYPAGDDKNPGLLDQMVFVSRATGDTVTVPVSGGVQIPTDEWCKVQYEARVSPLRVRVWVNDVLVQTEEGAGMNFGSSTAFSEFQQGAVWGGGNIDPAPSGALIKYAATAIWTN
jgi:hypothetical protein